MPNLFKSLQRLFSGGSPPTNPSDWVVVKCRRCGEIVRARVDLYNDLSPVYGEGEGGEPTFFCRKVLIGEQHCFNRMEVTLRFDARRRLIDRQVSGGEFVDET